MDQLEILICQLYVDLKKEGMKKKERKSEAIASGHKVAAMVGFLGFSINWPQLHFI